MINKDALVIYKGKPALVKEIIDGKYSVFLKDGDGIKVRDKDIEMLHPGPVKNFSEIEGCNPCAASVKESWELLLEEENANLSLKELSGFIYNEYTPSSAYAVFCLLRDALYFAGTIESVAPRSRDEVLAEETKRNDKQRETGERSLFLEQIKICVKKSSNGSIACLPADLLSKWALFFQDIEALACGKTAKSRTMRELDLGETPEDAHFVLLKSGFWTGMVNPHPGRYGLTLNSADIIPDAPPKEDERHDLCHLEAFAIDSPWSNDPDDAISIENADSSSFLYVHVADPASSIGFDSPAEKEARDRGATLYLPEGTVRMLAEEAVDLFGLGLTEKSTALTFKIRIDNESGEIKETEIFPSVVKVRRITYEEADRLMGCETEEVPALRALFNLAQKINERRSAHGAVNIDLPDVRIYLEEEKVRIDPIPEYRSSFIVKECMIAAGEGAGNWAASRGLSFPYISQEVELQGDHSRVAMSGTAGSIQLRKCMRPRVLSVKPGRHQGLGLDTYTQVTSPLRRYTDLLAHIQIRAFLRGEGLLGADEISARLGFCEAAASAVVHAERASNNHWKMVFLSEKEKDTQWDAVTLEEKGNRMSVLIPDLALETQVVMQNSIMPNKKVKLKIKSVNIPRGEAVFTHSEKI